MTTTDYANTTLRVRPPRAFLIAIAAQLPVLVITPPRFSALSIAVAGVVAAMGSMMVVWAERLFQSHSVGVCPFSEAPVLVRRGPYRVTRNPMYLGLVTIHLAVILATGALANIWSSLAFAMWLHYEYVIPEEAFLRERFGNAFDNYAADVPRWFGVPPQLRW